MIKLVDDFKEESLMFKDLKIGETFERLNDSNIYMKLCHGCDSDIVSITGMAGSTWTDLVHPNETVTPIELEARRMK